MTNQEHIFTVLVQTVPDLYSPYPACTQFSTTRQHPNVFNRCPALSIFTAYVQRFCYLHSTSPNRTPQLQQFYCQCLVSTTYLLCINNQNTISHTYVQSIHHPFCPCSITTPSFLPITNENSTFPAHVMSIHISCPCPVRMPPRALCPCLVKILSF